MGKIKKPLMLDLVRKHAKSWVISALLFFIILVFVFYFGVSSFKNQSPVAGEATVNGVEISQAEVNGALAIQRESNPMLANLPESLIPQIRKSILNSLIQKRVLEKEAHHLGIRVPDSVLAQEIQNTPSLLREGKFDYNFYQEQFRPFYLNRFGIDFEDAMRSDLALEQVRSLFQKSIYISDAWLKYEANLEDPKLSFKRIIIPISNPTPETKAQALETANSLWKDFITGKVTEESLKDKNLHLEELPPTSPLEASNLLPPPTNLDTLSQLFALTKQNPHLGKPIEHGNAIYLFLLTNKSTPSETSIESNRMEKIGSLAEQSFEHFYSQAAQKSDIRISSPNP